MNCFVHSQSPAVGLCAVCQKALCPACVGVDAPRLVCRTCVQRPIPLMMGFEYRSPIEIGTWPLLHVCVGIDPTTLRPRVARGIIAIGNIAVGVVAIAGLSLGLVTIGGASFGVLFALGGAAIGLGLSIGGLAVGSIAVGGLAVGFMYAIGAAAFGPSVISAQGCGTEALEFARRWFGPGIVPSNCR